MMPVIARPSDDRSTTVASPSDQTVTLERDGHVLLMGLDRPAKRNAFDRAMLADLARAYALLEHDDDLRSGVLFAHGEHFTAGLDLADVAPAIASGSSPFPEDGRDPWRLDGTWSKPIVAAAHGWAMTLGIELLLAADVRIAAAGTRFAQIEVRRGIYPFGGATLRFPQVAGWGNAMRWILTGDELGAEEALRIGLVQEIAPDADAARERALSIARTIAQDAAPLGVRAALASAHRARLEGDQAAIDQLVPEVQRLFATADAAEGVQSFVERRPAVFAGR
jgi:enoyl-CoA hydratase